MHFQNGKLDINKTIDLKLFAYWLLTHGAEILAVIATVAAVLLVQKRYPKLRWLPFIAALITFFLVREVLLDILEWDKIQRSFMGI